MFESSILQEVSPCCTGSWIKFWPWQNRWVSSRQSPPMHYCIRNGQSESKDLSICFTFPSIRQLKKNTTRVVALIASGLCRNQSKWPKSLAKGRISFLRFLKRICITYPRCGKNMPSDGIWCSFSTRHLITTRLKQVSNPMLRICRFFVSGAEKKMCFSMMPSFSCGWMVATR